MAETQGTSVLNCYAEGFPTNFFNQASNSFTLYIGNNASFNSDTDYNLQGDVLLNAGENNTLSASGLTDQSGGDWTPTSDSNMQGASFGNTPNGLSSTTGSRDIGAVQAVIPTSSGFFGSGIPFGF